MNHKWKMGVICFMALILLTPLGLGCAKEAEEGKVSVTIGHLTDMTGAAASVGRPLLWALEDLVRHINEEDPIPGVELKVVTYDIKLDPARDIPGYEWVKERGAKVIVALMSSTAEALKPFAARDKIPVAGLSVSTAMVEPPGWVFAFLPPLASQIRTLLDWISNEWDYAKGKPKIGCAGYADAYGIDGERGMREYCLANQDQFEYAGGYLAPFGVMTWTSETEKLRDCDYVFISALGGVAYVSYISESQGKGYAGKFIHAEGLAAFFDLLIEKCGWETLDGSLGLHSWGWWNETWPAVELVKSLLYEYHPREAENVVYAGIGYIGGGLQQLFFLEILRKAIEEVGAEDFDGQAFYDTAVEFKTTWEGYPERGFTETRRYCVTEQLVYEFSAEAGDLVRRSDWIPIID